MVMQERNEWGDPRESEGDKIPGRNDEHEAPPGYPVANWIYAELKPRGEVG